MTLTIILSVLFFILCYSFFDGLQTVIADKPSDNVIAKYCLQRVPFDTGKSICQIPKYQDLFAWYWGNNKDYSPSWFWSSNPWHMAKWGRLYSLSACIGIAVAPYLHWWALLFPLIAHYEGIGFIIGYHRLFRTGDSRLTWKEVLQHIFNYGEVKR